MSGKSAVVVGANRGIGLQLCKQLKSKGYTVYGSTRKPAPEIKSAGAEVIEGVDVGVDGGTAPLSTALQGKKVDLVICNAGVLIEDNLNSISIDDIRKQFEINTLGPLRTAMEVMPNLDKGSKLVVITSRMGSIADGSGGEYGYRTSKAGVNMIFHTLAHDLKSKGIAVGIIHPGFVQTDMTAKYHGAGGIIQPEQSASGIIDVIETKLSDATSGSFWHQNGTILPW